MVRSEHSAKQLIKTSHGRRRRKYSRVLSSLLSTKTTPIEPEDDDTDSYCPLEHVIIADVTSPTFVEDLSSSFASTASTVSASSSTTEKKKNDDNIVRNNKSNMDSKLKTITNKIWFFGDKNKKKKERKMKRKPPTNNFDAMIICTSAVPKIKKRSLVIMVLKIPLRILQRKKQIIDIKSMQFTWKHNKNGYPKIVDYYGQINQIQLAIKLNIPHIILGTCSICVDSFGIVIYFFLNYLPSSGYFFLLLPSKQTNNSLIIILFLFFPLLGWFACKIN